jgi:hypothetical protein
MSRYGLTCADCGTEMAKVAKSLPQGRARCHTCRRADPRYKSQRAAPLGHRACRRCGQTFDRQVKGQMLCWNPCRPRLSGSNPRASTSERGYGAAHAKARREALAGFKPGDPCARCRGPMLDGQALDLDHNDDRTGYLGLSHASCNRSSTGRLDCVRREAVCDHCGLTYRTRYRDQRFCSVPCRREWAKAHPRPTKPAPLKPAVQLELFRVCAVCDQGHQRASDYCSLRCQNRTLYRIRRGIPIDAPLADRWRAA